MGLGPHELASEHLSWAARFGLGDAVHVALQGNLLIAQGQPDRALALGNDYLAAHSKNSGPVRFMLAYTLGLGLGTSPTDQERAIEALRPLVEDAGVDLRERVAALALSATFQLERGHAQEFERLIHELDRLEGSLPSPELRKLLAEIRGLIPSPEVNGIEGANPGARRLVSKSDLRQLFEKVKEVSVRPVARPA